MTTRLKINNENAFSMIQDQLESLVIENQGLLKFQLLEKLNLDFVNDLDEEEINFIFDKIDEIRDCYSLDSDED